MERNWAEEEEQGKQRSQIFASTENIQSQERTRLFHSGETKIRLYLPSLPFPRSCYNSDNELERSMQGHEPAQAVAEFAQKVV